MGNGTGVSFKKKKKDVNIIYNLTSALSSVGTSLGINHLYFEVAAYCSLFQTFGYGQFAAFNLSWHIVKPSQLTTSKHIKHKFAVWSKVACWLLHLVAHHSTKRALNYTEYISGQWPLRVNESFIYNVKTHFVNKYILCTYLQRKLFILQHHQVTGT